MTQQDLAEKAFLDVRVVSAYENDKRRPRTKNLKRLVAALGGTLLPEGTDRGGDSGAPGATGTSADHEKRSVSHGEIIIARDAEMIVVWKGKDGSLSAIAAGFDKRPGRDSCARSGGIGRGPAFAARPRRSPP